MAQSDDIFAPYESYLSGIVWPSVEGRRGEMKHTAAVRDEMPPQYAAAALAKLVRWARLQPAGDVALGSDEDVREEMVRVSALGVALAARACNLDPEHFHALYGEFGVGKDAQYQRVLVTLAVSLGDNGLADWSIHDRADLAAALIKDLVPDFRITERVR